MLMIPCNHNPSYYCHSCHLQTRLHLHHHFLCSLLIRLRTPTQFLLQPQILTLLTLVICKPDSISITFSYNFYSLLLVGACSLCKDTNDSLVKQIITCASVIKLIYLLKLSYFMHTAPVLHFYSLEGDRY